MRAPREIECFIHDAECDVAIGYDGSETALLLAPAATRSYTELEGERAAEKECRAYAVFRSDGLNLRQVLALKCQGPRNSYQS
jgi:hypothetical protein